MKTSQHLMKAINDWQAKNKTTMLPTKLVATADVVHDLQRQNAIPAFLTVTYIDGEKILRVEE